MLAHAPEQLTLAACLGRIDEVRAALEAGVHPDAMVGHEHSALGCAARHGHFELLKLLLDYGASVRSLPGVDSALAEAASVTGSHAVVMAERLLEHGAEVSELGPTGLTPLNRAVILGSDEMIGWVLEHGGWPAPGRRSILHDLAARRGDAAHWVAPLLPFGDYSPRFSSRSRRGSRRWRLG